MLIEPQTRWEYAMELMPTEIGATNGTPGAHLVTDVPTLTMDLKPFLKLKIGMLFRISKNQEKVFYYICLFFISIGISEISFWNARTKSSFSTPFTLIHN